MLWTLRVIMHINPIVSQKPFLWCLPSLHALIVFLPLLPLDSLSPEGRDLKETSHLGQTVPRSHFALCPAVGLCICSHLMDEEAPLVMAEKDTDL